LHRTLIAGLLVWCLSIAACGTPVEVRRADARTVQTELTSNALTTGRLSGSTQILLRRFDLLGIYADAPPVAIQALNQIAAAGDTDRSLLFALAEMTFLQAERTSARSYFLATVVYSYAFLFPDLPADRPKPFDPRLRTAADLYNRALTRGLVAPDGEHIDLRGGEFALPFGTLSIDFDPRTLRWAGRGLANFVAAAELHIEGLKNRYRETGIGAPLAADLVVTDDQRGFQVARHLKVSTTALLRLDITPAAIASGRYNGRLTLYPGNEERIIEIGRSRSNRRPHSPTA
jgi:hypothetical protein